MINIYNLHTKKSVSKKNIAHICGYMYMCVDVYVMMRRGQPPPVARRRRRIHPVKKHVCYICLIKVNICINVRILPQIPCTSTKIVGRYTIGTIYCVNA